MERIVGEKAVRLASVRPRVYDREHENIRGAHADQIVHNDRHVGLWYHGADCNPIGLFEGCDGWGALAGCDLDRSIERRPGNVVLAQHILLGT